MTANLSVDLDGVRQLIRESPPGTVIVMARDVYDRLLEEEEIPGISLGNVHGVQVRTVSSVAPGTVMVMASGIIPAPVSWANRFLAKAGPVTSVAKVTLQMQPTAMVNEAAPPKAPKPPRPPAPPKPPTPPKPPVPRTRLRIVDT